MEAVHQLQHEKMIFVRRLRKKLQEVGKYDGSLLQLMDFYDVKETEFSPNPLWIGTGVKTDEPKLSPPEKKKKDGSSAPKKRGRSQKSQTATNSRVSPTVAVETGNNNDLGKEDEEDVVPPQEVPRPTTQVTKSRTSRVRKREEEQKKKEKKKAEGTGASSEHSAVRGAKRNRPVNRNDDFEYY
jgi:hypothetical protein